MNKITISIIDKQLKGIELTESNIPLFKQAGMINKVNIETT